MVRGIASWLEQAQKMQRIASHAPADLDLWIGHRARCLVKVKRGPSRLEPQDGCAGQHHRLHAIADWKLWQSPANGSTQKTPAPRSASGERDSFVQSWKLFLTFPSRDRIVQRSSAPSRISVPSKLGYHMAERSSRVRNIRHVHMPADCAADAPSPLWGIVIVSVRSMMLRTTIGRFTSGGKALLLPAARIHRGA